MALALAIGSFSRVAARHSSRRCASGLMGSAPHALGAVAPVRCASAAAAGGNAPEGPGTGRRARERLERYQAERQRFMKYDIMQHANLEPALSKDPKAPIAVKITMRRFKRVEHEWEQPHPLIRVGHTLVSMETRYSRQTVSRSFRGMDMEGNLVVKPLPGDEVVKGWVKVGDIGLSERAREVLLDIVGPRYSPKSDLLKVVARKYPTRQENVRYMCKLLKAMIRECQVYEGPTEADIRRIADDEEEAEERALREQFEQL